MSVTYTYSVGGDMDNRYLDGYVGSFDYSQVITNSWELISSNLISARASEEGSYTINNIYLDDDLETLEFYDNFQSILDNYGDLRVVKIVEEEYQNNQLFKVSVIESETPFALDKFNPSDTRNTLEDFEIFWSGDDVFTAVEGSTEDNEDYIAGYGGDDTFTGYGGNDRFDGGDGVDTSIYTGNFSDYTVSIEDDIAYVNDQSGTDGNDVLELVERLVFTDTNVAIDLNANAGDAAKLLGITFGGDSVDNK